MLKHTDYLTKVYGKPEGWTLDAYERELGGYKQAQRVLTTMTREQVVDEAKKANIRGRGGAGFPMGVKWSFMPKAAAPTKPALPRRQRRRRRARDAQGPDADGARTLTRASRAASSAATAIGAHVAYIYVRDELHLSKARLWGAIEEAKAKGYLGKTPFGKDYPIEVYVHTGAGAYICGEETSLLNSLEGQPRRAAPQAPLPRASRRVRLPDDGEQPRDDRGRPDRVPHGLRRVQQALGAPRHRRTAAFASSASTAT